MEARVSQRLRIKETQSLLVRTVSHPALAENPAARVRSRRDVVEACDAVAIQPGIREAERCLALRKPVIIQWRDNTYCGLYVGGWPHARGWTEQRKTHEHRATRSTYREACRAVDHHEVERLRGDVG